MDRVLLAVEDLKTHFFYDDVTIRAVDGVSFNLREGETIGIVGESGCGKTITGMSILQLVPMPGKVIGGKILLRLVDERVIDIAELEPRGREVRKIRGKEISMIFQEPMTSLNPVYTIGNQIIEGIRLHNKISKVHAREMAISLLSEVGIPKAEEIIDMYSFQLSGGMRQRAMIAMALSCNPRLLIADEPTTAIDVTIQAQILELLKEIQEKRKMSMILITHNLGIVAEMVDDIIVMYLGRAVEQGNVIDVYDNPLHPYTKALMRSIPRLGDRQRRRLPVIKGSIPDPHSNLKGCMFQPRCDKAIKSLCDTEEPSLIEAEEGHYVRCFLYGKKEVDFYGP